MVCIVLFLYTARTRYAPGAPTLPGELPMYVARAVPYPPRGAVPLTVANKALALLC
jgi:hypothetical protein